MQRRQSVRLVVLPGKDRAKRRPDCYPKACAQGSGWNTSFQASVSLNHSVAHLAANDLPTALDTWQQALIILGNPNTPDAAKVRVELAGQSPGG